MARRSSAEGFTTAGTDGVNSKSAKFSAEKKEGKLSWTAVFGVGPWKKRYPFPGVGSVRGGQLPTSPRERSGLKLAWNFYRAQWRVRRELVYTFFFELASLVVLMVAVFLISPRKSILYVYGAQTMGQAFINSINFLQHDGCEIDPAHDGFNHARNFTGWFFNYIFLNNGYHTIHHMKPGLHWSVLPAHHQRSVAPHIHPNLEVPCFRKHLWKTMWTREDYLGRPITPGDSSRDWSLLDEAIQFDTPVVYETDAPAESKPHAE
ncbi:hypothetical protein AB1Y20_012957 [Prymnesium parvum]|uniref:Fatty acid desaturase domain-containing protein n=1 Tax=Prymnesium parvum TaxID=97485 RepID=A0AB34IK43_PRYPA